MALGRFVIERATATKERPGPFMGPAGWMPLKRQALQFSSSDDAEGWLAEQRAAGSRLLAAGARVTEFKMTEEERALAVPRPVKSEFDPYREAG